MSDTSFRAHQSAPPATKLSCPCARDHRPRDTGYRATRPRITASSPSIRASASPRAARARSPTSTAMRRAAVSRLSGGAAGGEEQLHGGALPAAVRRTADARSSWRSSRDNIRRHTMINESLLRFFSGFHHNAHPMAMVSAVVASMSAFYHDSMDIHNPRHREIFAHRIIAKMPTIAAAAYKHSLGQPFIYPRNDLDYCTNLLQHVLRGALRAVQGGSGGGGGAGSAVHPARGSRAERQHLHRAPGRQHRRQSLCGDLGRRVGAVGSGPWRRQRGRAGDARADRHGREHPEVPGHGQGQDRPLPPDGFRASRVQELRSARQHHPRDLLQGAGEARAARTIRCWNWRCGWRRSR